MSMLGPHTPAWATLQRLAAQPVSHDHLFHTLLGLLDVRTGLHVPAFDLTPACRTTPVAPRAVPT